MSDSDNIKLWCWVLGDPSNRVFSVSLGRSANIEDLKGAVQGRKPSFRNIAADSLQVFQFQLPLEDFNEDCAQSIKLEDSQRLKSWKQIPFYWKKDPGEVLSVILPRPAGTTITSQDSTVLPNPSSSWLAEVQNVYLRRDTVAGLYERLKRHHFIQVRGTPASGKTVLARLLGTHISQQDPGVHVIWIQGWPQRVAESRDYQSYLQSRGWIINRATVFIFDEAQATYCDGTLWHHFFKSMETFNARVIVFCSYGSPSLRINVGDTMENPVPISAPDHQRVTLRHVDHEDDLPPVGLLFTQSEFNDLVKNQKSYFDESFFDTVFRITNGHVGAIHDFIQIVISDRSFREIKHAGELYTWDSFLAAFTPENLLRRLGSTAVFSRGLPPDEALQSSATAGVFSTVLSKNVVTEADFGTCSEKSDMLQQCFCNGWLHADKFITNSQVDTGYFFPSSLHRWYVEWKLWGNVSQEGARFANSLLELVIDVIRLFSPNLLSAERRLGPGCIQRPPEAQYQDELYRCCHALSEGSLVTFPEFGTAKGCVDFYIPAKRWGIELLRDGNRLTSHCGRFSEKGSYRSTIPLTDYIIVDCRTTRSLEEHPHMSNLYHAVFEDDFTHVCILDNRLREVRSFPLLRSS